MKINKRKIIIGIVVLVGVLVIFLKRDRYPELTPFSRLAPDMTPAQMQKVEPEMFYQDGYYAVYHSDGSMEYYCMISLKDLEEKRIVWYGYPKGDGKFTNLPMEMHGISLFYERNKFQKMPGGIWENHKYKINVKQEIENDEIIIKIEIQYKE